MSTHGPFSSGPGFTVYKDEPKANGRGTVGPTGLSAEEELVAALIANPNLAPVAAKIGLKETHFLQETGLRGAFQFAPKGRAWIHRPKYLIQRLCRENLMMEYYFDQPTVFSVSLNEGNSGFPNLVDHCLESFHKTP